MNPQYESCQECGAPLDRQQRYCVNCAARRSDASNPASRYFAAASRQRRLARAPADPERSARSGTGRAAAVFFFALLPIAVAIGVVVGRTGNGDEDKLLAALREGNATAAVASTDAGTGQTATVSSKLLVSDFSLDKGFVVELDQLPIDGTDEAAAEQAKSDAEDKGAKDVGIINPGDFTTKPDQGQENYLLYSGEFSDRGAAEKALTGLRKDFPDALVIEVTGASASAGGGSASSASGADNVPSKVVAQTSHGTVHQVTGMKPTDEQVQEDTQIVQQIANQTGQNYTDSQQSLPDVTVVGGDPGDAPPLPTGAGD